MASMLSGVAGPAPQVYNALAPVAFRSLSLAPVSNQPCFAESLFLYMSAGSPPTKTMRQ